MRLNSEIRNQIIRSLVTKTFEPKEEELLKKRTALGDDFWRMAYTDRQRRSMRQLPKGFFPLQDTIRVTILDHGNYDHVRMSKPRLLAFDQGHRTPIGVEPDSDLGKRYLRLIREEEALRGEKRKAINQARQILASVSTPKRLIEIWPEVAPFIPEIQKPNTDLSIPIKDVNASFGLEQK